MKLTCGYNVLVSSLTDISAVVEDALSAEDMKNIIFKINKSGEVQLIGINQLITYRKSLTEGFSIDDTDAKYNDSGVCYMQVKSKELTQFLNTFKSLRKTTPTDVELAVNGNRIEVTVTEVEDETEKIHKSNWSLDNIQIKQNIMPLINMEMPEEEVSEVATDLVLFYTANLLPIMKNDNSLYGKLVFGEDKVVAFNAAFNSLIENMLPAVFKGMSLSYRAVAFMKNVICNSPSAKVARTQSHICFKTATSEAFIVYDSRVADYSIYANMFKKDHAIVLDRQYLKDVLKRLSLVNESIRFRINPETSKVEVKNTKFTQEIDILDKKNMDELGVIEFKILPEVLVKAIIGDDNAFSSNVFMYLVPSANGGYVLIFSDNSGKWFSTASIR